MIDAYQRIRALTFQVKVNLVESLGADKYLYFTTESPAVHSVQLDELAEVEGESALHENQFVARVPAESKVAIGQSVELAFDTARLAVFDADSGANLTIPHRANGGERTHKPPPRRRIWSFLRLFADAKLEPVSVAEDVVEEQTDKDHPADHCRVTPPESSSGMK